VHVAALKEAVVRREWEPEDVVACWTLVEQDERELVSYKRGATRLGFALMLKFFELEARFPRHASEFPYEATDHWGDINPWGVPFSSSHTARTSSPRETPSPSSTASRRPSGAPSRPQATVMCMSWVAPT
jgi:hypothetical protein